MFCPQCATENQKEQRYCRQCGVPLTAVRLAVEGRVEEALKRYKKSENLISWGLILASIGLVNAGINAFLHAWQSAVFSAGFGLVLGITLIVWGLNRLGNASKLLTPPEKDETKTSPVLAQSENAALPPAPITEELISRPARPPSVVENTTIKLKPPQ
ncbi:MAG TPA: zinc-ribbon domain-containing protein [Pyrinomonadaceae bacterium]